MSRAARVRVLCVRGRSILLIADEGGWSLPVTEVAASETAEQAAARVLLEECGIRARLLRRMPPQQAVRGLVGDWLVTAETDGEIPPLHVEGAAFHPLTAERPVGPLDLWLWGGLATIIASAAHQSTWIGAQVRHSAA